MAQHQPKQNKPAELRQPKVGDVVHFVAVGDSLDTGAGQHRAAIVTATQDGGAVKLHVFHPAYDYRAQDVPEDQANKLPGSWHFAD